MSRIIEKLIQNLPLFVVTLDKNRFGALMLLALVVAGLFGLHDFRRGGV